LTGSPRYGPGVCGHHLPPARHNPPELIPLVDSRGWARPWEATEAAAGAPPADRRRAAPRHRAGHLRNCSCGRVEPRSEHLCSARSFHHRLASCKSSVDYALGRRSQQLLLIKPLSKRQSVYLSRTFAYVRRDLWLVSESF
jgi:hypothetical protein